MNHHQSIFEMTLGQILKWFVTWFPGPIGDRLRYGYYRKRLKKLGKGVRICEGVEIQSPEFVSVGDNTWIDRNVIIIAGPLREGNRVIKRKLNNNFQGFEGHLYIGVGCHLAPFSLIQAHGGVSIGNFITVASGVKIYSMSHHYREENIDSSKIYKFSSMAPDADQLLIVAPVVLKDNSAVGLNSVILPGVTIGKNSWVGVLTWVKQDIPSGSIVIGAPGSIKIKQ